MLQDDKVVKAVQAGGEQEEAVGAWDVASRLSYFLWASMPDEELFELAEGGSLLDPEVLRDQVDRMIDDERSDTLGTVLAAQWLGFDNVGTRVRADPIDNPFATDTLYEAMRAETSLLFMSLVS